MNKSVGNNLRVIFVPCEFINHLILPVSYLPSYLLSYVLRDPYVIVDFLIVL